MPSLADIPDRLLKDTEYARFLDWLFQYHLGWIDTKQFIGIWCRFLNRRLTGKQWRAVEDRWVHANVRS